MTDYISPKSYDKLDKTLTGFRRLVLNERKREPVMSRHHSYEIVVMTPARNVAALMSVDQWRPFYLTKIYTFFPLSFQRNVSGDLSFPSAWAETIKLCYHRCNIHLHDPIQNFSHVKRMATV